MTAKEYLQEKHEWHRKHWNEHELIDDNWWANEMEEYHQAKLKLLGIAAVSKSFVCTYCGIDPIKETCKNPKKCYSKEKIPTN